MKRNRLGQLLNPKVLYQQFREAHTNHWFPFRVLRRIASPSRAWTWAQEEARRRKRRRRTAKASRRQNRR